MTVEDDFDELRCWFCPNLHDNITYHVKKMYSEFDVEICRECEQRHEQEDKARAGGQGDLEEPAGRDFEG